MIDTLIEKYLNADITSQAFIEAQTELQAYMVDKGIEDIKVSSVGDGKFAVSYVLPVADAPFGDNLDDLDEEVEEELEPSTDSLEEAFEGLDEFYDAEEDVEFDTPCVEVHHTGIITILDGVSEMSLSIDMAEELLNRLGWAIESAHRANERVPF